MTENKKWGRGAAGVGGSNKDVLGGKKLKN